MFKTFFLLIEGFKKFDRSSVLNIQHYDGHLCIAHWKKLLAASGLIVKCFTLVFNYYVQQYSLFKLFSLKLNVNIELGYISAIILVWCWWLKGKYNQAKEEKIGFCEKKNEEMLCMNQSLDSRCDWKRTDLNSIRE